MQLALKSPLALKTTFTLMGLIALGLTALPAAAQTATYVFDSDYGQWYQSIGSTSSFPFTYENDTTGGLFTSADHTLYFLSDLTISGTANTPADITETPYEDRTITNFTAFLNDATIQITDVNGLVVDTYTGSLSCSGQFYVPENYANLSGDVFDSSGKEYAFSYAATSDDSRGQYTALASFTPVPEASTTASFGLLLALGLGGVIVAAKRKKAGSAA